MRFDEKFKVDIRVAENLILEDVQIPPMIIQPYVENAIRHGLLHRGDDKGVLVIEFSILGDDLNV